MQRTPPQPPHRNGTIGWAESAGLPLPLLERLLYTGAPKSAPSVAASFFKEIVEPVATYVTGVRASRPRRSKRAFARCSGGLENVNVIDPQTFEALPKTSTW